MGEPPMHVIIIRLFVAVLYICVFIILSVLLGACAKPVEQRNVWREWLDNP